MANTISNSPLVQAASKTLGTYDPTYVDEAPDPVEVEIVDTTPLIITKFQFRKLFTTAERVIIDNIQYNQNFSASVKAVVATLIKDLDVSGDVNLHLADVIQGVTFLQQIGILTPVRCARILANLPPL